MSEPSNEIIYQTLLDQNKSLGRIEATLATHVVEDKATAAKVDTLMVAHQTQRGAIKTLVALWSIVAAVLGAGITAYFHR